VRDELMTAAPPEPLPAAADAVAVAGRIAVSMRKTVLVALGLAMETWGDALQNEQEALMALSDLIIDAFAVESAALRAAQAASASHPLAALHADAASVIAHDAGLRAEATARTLLGSMLAGDAQRTALAALRRVLKVPPVDTVAARRRIADVVSSRRAYPFS
jgi:hypothetical protein